MRRIFVVAVVLLPLSILGSGTVQAKAPFGPLHVYLYSTAPYPAYQDAVIERESNWEPWATNPYSGATGLAQFMPSTWEYAEGFCEEWGSPYDPYVAMDLMSCLLRAGQWWHWACNGEQGCYDIDVQKPRLLP